VKKKKSFLSFGLSYFVVLLANKQAAEKRRESHMGPVRHTLAGTQADVKVGGDATTQRSSCGQHQNGK
jgi:hypothetical protein